jgi:hypothetical protein
MAFKRWKQTERGRSATQDDDGAFVTFPGPKAAAGYRKMLKRNPRQVPVLASRAAASSPCAFVLE